MQWSRRKHTSQKTLGTRTKTGKEPRRVEEDRDGCGKGMARGLEGDGKGIRVASRLHNISPRMPAIQVQAPLCFPLASPPSTRAAVARKSCHFLSNMTADATIPFASSARCLLFESMFTNTFDSVCFNLSLSCVRTAPDRHHGEAIRLWWSCVRVCKVVQRGIVSRVVLCGVLCCGVVLCVSCVMCVCCVLCNMVNVTFGIDALSVR